ncbi:hypothetical protein IMZ48_25500, partial [Candidatus Bathyarchaeota archaeon]|nr:hypothetical protein [Candidatus Bathyarchaeota archaeon]
MGLTTRQEIVGRMVQGHYQQRIKSLFFAFWDLGTALWNIDPDASPLDVLRFYAIVAHVRRKHNGESEREATESEIEYSEDESEDDIGGEDVGGEDVGFEGVDYSQIPLAVLDGVHYAPMNIRAYAAMNVRAVIKAWHVDEIEDRRGRSNEYGGDEID